jgi:hypothetical protein
LDNDDYNEDEKFVKRTKYMLDNPELTYLEGYNETIAASVQQKFSGIPTSIRSLAFFYKPNPQVE